MTAQKSESSFLIKEIRANGIPPFWKDTKKMQEAYSLNVKGRVCSVLFLKQKPFHKIGITISAFFRNEFFVLFLILWCLDCL